jgi:hypothetical protein
LELWRGHIKLKRKSVGHRSFGGLFVDLPEHIVFRNQLSAFRQRLLDKHQIKC